MRDPALTRKRGLQDPAYNTVEEHPLTMDEFENFLHRRVCDLVFLLPKSNLHFASMLMMLT